jgi:hypothetical protein
MGSSSSSIAARVAPPLGQQPVDFDGSMALAFGTEPVRDDFSKQVQAYYRDVASKMPNNGCAFDIPTMRKNYPAIHNLPIDVQANYADAVTVWFGKDPRYYALGGHDDEGDYSKLNTTSIGNTAYIALHNEDPEVRRKCLDMLARFKNYRDQQWQCTIC